MNRSLNKYFLATLGLLAITLLNTTDLRAKCIVRILDKHFLVRGSCAEVHDCINTNIKCVDLPIMFDGGGQSVDVKSRTEVSVVIGKDKFLLASDEAQAKFDEMWNKKKAKITMTELERTLAPIIQNNGTVTIKRFQEKTK
jgi:hypothetical protein